MSELLRKSEQNRQAALVLWSVNRWYAPSVHCSYYRCIQMIIHTIVVAGKKDHETIGKEINAWVKINKGGSHFYYFSEIRKILIAQGKMQFIKSFFDILGLKEFREKSDYKPIEITPELSDEAIKLSDKIADILNNKIKS